MNQRIKELIVESGNGQMRDGRLYPHIGIRFEEDWQRFAELIVKECIDQGKHVQSQTVSNGSEDYNNGRKMGIEVFMNQIKKHFGVE